MSKLLRKHCIRCKKEEWNVQNIPTFDPHTVIRPVHGGNHLEVIENDEGGLFFS
jgi:hypothetical protein